MVILEGIICVEQPNINDDPNGFAACAVLVCAYQIRNHV